ncbi:MAG TPA: AAA family ATPase [Caulobacteraceae bacterium]|nr:AAA family ATPase [Caulobacteraceae bacterium]
MGAAPHAETQTERRHLTVLSCQPVRAFGAGLAADPEEWRRTVQQYRLAVAEVVEPFGGFVARALGDKVIVYFGYPEAREDAAECAVRAGLAIVERTKALDAKSAETSGINRSVQIGIHAGLVVIAHSGHGLDMFGETPDVAMSVQAAAEPDKVAVSCAVHKLVARLFVFDPRPAHPLDEGADPISIRYVTAPAPAPRHEPRFRGYELTPYVGREDEMHFLSSRWKRARRGEGQLVLLTGEPGIGKTRLVREFRQRIQGDPHMWISCAGERLHSNTPFHAVVRMLDQAFHWRGDEHALERVEALEQVLERSGLELAEATPLIGELLKLEVPSRYPPLMLAPDQRRRRLLACLAAWVFYLARSEPLIIVVEDLHWVDPSSMELLQTLVEQSATAALMLLCTARPEFRAPWPTRSHHAPITLDRLSDKEARELATGVATRATLTPDLIDTVVRRTDGVPLFVEELTRLMVESGGLAGRSGIPATLHDSLAARLARTGRAKEVAQLGAVLGREFSYALIAAVSSMPADQLAADLARLADTELIYVRGVPPEANYQFKHALILDAAYEALLKGRRRELHDLVARTISEQFPDLAQSQPEILARHWWEAGKPDKAISAWTEAAAVAAARHAYQETTEDYRQALAILEPLPRSPDRDTRELEILIPLSAIVGVAKGYGSEEYRELFERGAGLAERGGNLFQLVLQVLGCFIRAFTAADYFKALALADQMLELARRVNNDPSLRLSHMAQIMARNGVGDLAGAERSFVDWTLVVERSGYGPFLGETIAVHCAMIETAFLLGRPDLARRRVAEARVIAEASESPFEMMLMWHIQAWLCVLLRDPQGAETAAASAFAIAEENDFKQVNQIRCSLAWARAHAGDPAQAVALIEASLPGWVGGGLPRLPEARRVLAQAQAINGGHAEAFAGLDALCEAPADNPAILAAHLICRAELRIESGQDKDAEDDLRAAIGLAQSRQAKALELRATTHLARLLGARGDWTGARLLARVYGGFTEGFDTADLKDAKALLDAAPRND